VTVLTDHRYDLWSPTSRRTGTTTDDPLRHAFSLSRWAPCAAARVSTPRPGVALGYSRHGRACNPNSGTLRVNAVLNGNQTLVGEVHVSSAGTLGLLFRFMDGSESTQQPLSMIGADDST